jgi:hypothetical protein
MPMDFIAGGAGGAGEDTDGQSLTTSVESVAAGGVAAVLFEMAHTIPIKKQPTRINAFTAYLQTKQDSLISSIY